MNLRPLKLLLKEAQNHLAHLPSCRYERNAGECDCYMPTLLADARKCLREVKRLLAGTHCATAKGKIRVVYTVVAGQDTHVLLAVAPLAQPQLFALLRDIVPVTSKLSHIYVQSSGLPGDDNYADGAYFRPDQIYRT